MIKISKIIENVLNNIITGIICLLLPSIYSTIIGSINNVSMIEVMCNIPVHIYLILFIPFILWVTRKCIKKKMNEGISLLGVSTYHDYQDIGHITYNDLLLIVQLKNSSFRHVQYYGNIKEYETFYEISKNLRIKSGPRCPKCGAELYFTQHDLWYTYDCVNPECSFKKRTWQSEDKMKDIAEKQYKYKLETEFYEKINNQGRIS